MSRPHLEDLTDPDRARRSALGVLPPGWWLDVECPCSPGDGVSLSVSAMMARVGPAPLLVNVAARLRCVRCGKRGATVTLTDSPARPPGFGYAPPATVRMRIVG